MRSTAVFLACVLAGCAAAQAQEPETALTPLEIAVACAPPPTLEMPAAALHVIGAQDTVARTLLDKRDLLVLDGGAKAGVQLGQMYFIRRPIVFGTDRSKAEGLLTLGWTRIVAVNDTTAIASVEHFCAGIIAGDYLDRFMIPMLPADAEGDDASGEPDFSSLGRVLFGVENRATAGRGDLILIDRGMDQGVKPGARFSVYRDLRTDGLPLAEVGEGVVLTTGKSMSLTRITRSRDAIVSGDYVVPRK